MILETLAGSLLGGVFRLAPEVIKVFDRKNERQHEGLMMDKEFKFAELKNQAIEHKSDADMSIKELDAVSKALTEQGKTARAAGWFVAAVSALVRPLVTYWFVGFYSFVKIMSIYLAVVGGSDWKEVLVLSWTADDMAILSMILTFWFVGRVYERQRK